MDKMKKVFRYKELYPVYLNVMFCMAAKCYYQNGYFARLKFLGIDPDNMQYVFSISNFCSVLAGLFNFMKLEHAHLINLGISVLFNILVLTY